MIKLFGALCAIGCTTDKASPPKVQYGSRPAVRTKGFGVRNVTPFGFLSARAPAALMAALYIVTVLATSLLPMAQAEAARGDRVLDLYYTHTKERKQFKFRKRGKFDQAVLKELNYFLRDWRRSEPTNMDPALFDLVWEVYQDTRASGPIHVVSAYRSPATNNMLRSRSRGVAKNSQHTNGRAMDFFIPGMHMQKVRDAGLRKHVGGVGYYPRSNTPFVHLDTGSVRHWPRMSRKELAEVFPRGDTVHVPTDGKPFSGYNVAMAQMEKRKRTAARFKPGRDAEEESESGGGFLALLGFGRKKDEPAPAPARATPAPSVVVEAPSRTILPPVPGTRPGDLPSIVPQPDLPAILEEAPVLVAALPPAPRIRPVSSAAVALAALDGGNGLPDPVPADQLPLDASDPARASIVALAALPRTRPANPGVTLASLGPSQDRVPPSPLETFAEADPIARIAAAVPEKIEDRLAPGQLPIAATAYAPAISETRARAEAIIPVRAPDTAKQQARLKPAKIDAPTLRHHKGPAYRQLLDAGVSVEGKDVAWLAAPKLAGDLLRGTSAASTGFSRTLSGPSTTGFSGSALR